MTSRHEFLAQLHELLKPKTYLEIGVQHGWSLDLAHRAELPVGVDPHPLVEAKGNQSIFPLTSDEFFNKRGFVLPPVDLAFIDGMHLYEYALRDFINVLRYVHKDSVVVFDDVLPRNQGEANRVQCPGDWTGDVWKIHRTVPVYRPDLKFRLVDTQPTGLLLVTGFDKKTNVIVTSLNRVYGSLAIVWSKDYLVPDDVINRESAWQPERALEEVRNGMEAPTV